MEETPQIIIQDFKGQHNLDLIKSADRLKQARSSVDLSTICIIPNNGLIPARVAENWLGHVSQMNQKFVRLMAIGVEKNFAFNSNIDMILATPALKSFKYVLTLEENVAAPIDGLMKLFESIEKYDVVGGLAFTPGQEGRAMVYGQPQTFPQNFLPIFPQKDSVQECLAVGTGFTLFKLDIFKDPKVPHPWFRTLYQNKPNKNINDIDMYFFENIHRLGYKVACDTRVKVATLDPENDIFW